MCIDGTLVSLSQCQRIAASEFSEAFDFCGAPVATGTIVYGTTEIAMTPTEIGQIRLQFKATLDSGDQTPNPYTLHSTLKL